MTVSSIYAERLESVKKRIAAIRAVLEDESTLSTVSVDGVSESFDRPALVEELKNLEREETELTAKVAGTSSRLFRVVLR